MLGHAGPPRKCPRILNDWTQAQPQCDRNNMYRFPTHSFPFCLQTTVIVGMSIASAYTMYQHFVSDTEFDTFREFIETVSYDGMLNTWDAEHELGAPGASDDTRTPIPRPEPAPYTETSGGSAQHTPLTPGIHEPVPISSISGWQGNKQQRCSICNHAKLLTGWCCGGCSTAAAIVPVHRVGKVATCFPKHKRAPEAAKRCFASKSRSQAAVKRWRAGRGTGRGRPAGGRGRAAN